MTTEGCTTKPVSFWYAVATLGAVVLTVLVGSFVLGADLHALLVLVALGLTVFRSAPAPDEAE